MTANAAARELEKLALQAEATAATSASGGAAPAGGPSASAGSHDSRPASGKGSRGPRPRLFKKGECQADGCSADLSGLPRYHQRNHICVPHKVADEFWRLGVLVRFCQRCGVAHPLGDFDGLKKSCRKQLEVHNQRRRKGAAAAAPTETAAAAAGAVAPAASGSAAPVALAVAQPVQQQQLAAQPQPAQQLQAVAAVPLPAPLALPAARAPTAAAPAGSWQASIEASPTASVGSAALSAGLADDAAAWLLGDSGSGGGLELDGLDSLLALPPPDGGPLGDPPADLELMGLEGGLEGGLESGLPLAATACGAPADERVCCGGHERACGGCCASHERACGGCGAAAAGVAAAAGLAGASGPGPAAAGGRSGAAVGAAAAGGGSGRHGAAPQPAASCSGGAGALAGGGAATADGATAPAVGAHGAVVSSPAQRPQPQPQPSQQAQQEQQEQQEQPELQAELQEGGSGAAAATAALEQLQQHSPALFRLFVQQQLLAAQALLAGSAAVLSRPLPMLPQQPSLSTPAVSAH